MSVEVRGNVLFVRFAGSINVSQRDVLRFHPGVKELLDELERRGWNHSFEDVKGEAMVRVNLREKELSLHHYPRGLRSLRREVVTWLKWILASRNQVLWRF